MIRKKLIKSFLATTSITGVFAYGLNNADAFAGHKAIINNAQYSVPAHWEFNSPPINNDWIKLGGAFNIIADKGLSVEGLDLNGFTGGTLIASGKDSSMGSIYDTTGSGAILNIAFANNIKLTLDGTSTYPNIPQHNYTGLSKVNLDNNGTLYIASSNSKGMDLSNSMIYGAGTLSVATQEGGLFGFANEDTIFGGILGFNGSAANNTNITINTGIGQEGGGSLAGGNVKINAINTKGLISINFDPGAGSGGNGKNNIDGGAGGNVTVDSFIIGPLRVKGGAGGAGEVGGTGSGGSGSTITFNGDINSEYAQSAFGGGAGGAASITGKGGAGGNVILEGYLSATAITFIGGRGGDENGANAGGDGGSFIIQKRVTINNKAVVKIEPGLKGVGARGGVGGSIEFNDGMNLINAGAVRIIAADASVIIKGDIIGSSNTQALSLVGAGSDTIIDSSLKPISVTGSLSPDIFDLNGSAIATNAVNSNSIVFNDSLGSAADMRISGLNIQGDSTALSIFNAPIYSQKINISAPVRFNNIVNVGAAGTIKFLQNSTLFLGNNAAITIPGGKIDATAQGAAIIAASGTNATLNADVDATGHLLTLGAITQGNILNVTGALYGNQINISGAGSVLFTNDINIPLNLSSDTEVKIASGKSFGSNITSSVNNTGILSSDGSASILGTVSGIKLIQFNTLKVAPVNFVLSNPATIGTIDFNNGNTLNIGSGGSLTYSAFTNTGSTSQINITDTNSIISTGSGGSILPLIVTKGDTTFTGNLNVSTIQSVGSGNIILSNATISGGVTGVVSIGAGTNTVSTAKSAILNFTNSSGLLSILAPNEINNVTAVNSSGGGTLILSGGTLPVDIATPANRLISVQVAATSTLNNNGKNIYANNIMPVTSTANLTLSGNGFVGAVGSAKSKFNKITLNGFTAVSDMYAVNFDINGKVILNNSSLSGAINLGSGSLLDGRNGTLSGNIAGSGDIIVGQANLTNSIGSSGSNVGVVTLTPAEHTLGGDIFGAKVIADNSLLILSKSVQVANLSAQNLTLTPNSNSLSLPSGGDLDGLTTLNLTISSLSSSTNPYINITGGKLHLADLKINITDNVGIGNSGMQIAVISGVNDYSGIPEISASKLIRWNYNNKTGLLSAAFDKAAIDKVVDELKKEVSGIENYFDEANTGDAALAMDLIANATPEQAKEIVAELQSVSQDVAQSTTFNDITLDNVRNIIDQQTNNYFNDTQNEDLLAQADLGISAGEEEDKSRRVWISTTKTGKSDTISEPAKFSKFRLMGLSASGFGGFSDLGVIKGASGNRTKTYGATAGIDTRISERWMAGGAFTYTENNVAMHNALTGSTYFTKGWVATLYGLYNVTNSWSVRTGLSYGNNTSINNAKRLVRLPGVRMIAYAKYNSRFLSPDVSMSYRISLPKKISFVPSVGLQYTYTIADPYTEIGAKPLNMTVKKRPETGVLSGNIGLSFSTSFKIGETLIKPEIHGSFKKALRGRNPTTLSKIDGAARFIETKTHPTKKVTYSVGGSVAVATSKMLDLGVGYDASLAEKFIGHRGSLKVRINL